MITLLPPACLHSNHVSSTLDQNPSSFRWIPLRKRYSGGKPSLVFCGSKKDTETLAGSLAQGKDYSKASGSQVALKLAFRLDAILAMQTRSVRPRLLLNSFGCGWVAHSGVSFLNASRLVARYGQGMGVTRPSSVVIS